MEDPKELASNLVALQSALESANTYTRVAKVAENDELARHNYNNARFACASATELLNRLPSTESEATERLAAVTGELDTLVTRLR